jgi:hypothetical protein
MMGLLVVYCAVFALLVSVQFAKKGNFTQRVGPMLISGQYRLSADVSPANLNEYPLSGGVSVFFGGLEFRLDDRDDTGFFLTDADDRRLAALPEYMRLSGDTALFRLTDGTELVFSTRYAGGGPELWISGEFAGDASAVDIPFKPHHAAIVRESDNGPFTVLYNSTRYQFVRPVKDGRLLLQTDAPGISYRAIPEQRGFNVGNFVLSQAKNSQEFDAALSRWKAQNWVRWRDNITAQPDEDTVVACGAEAVRQGDFSAVAASVSPAFLANSRRTWVSSVYLGGMTQALRSFTAAERENFSRISLLIGEQSPDLLMENHVFEYLSVRGYTGLIETGLEIIRSMDPATLSLDMTPGIFEGYTDFTGLRLNTTNPFERLIDQACQTVTENLRRDYDLVFVFHGSSADITFNLRLGKALWSWGEKIGNSDWAALGRSLILSALALTDNAGEVPSTLILSDSGEISEAAGDTISSAKIYRIADPGEYFPAAVGIRSGADSIWAWTAATGASAVQGNGVINISVSFPVGETHYMMIRGIKPFSRLMLYNTNWPMDSLFERYDSSGWMYFAQEQTLVLKMKHRTVVEHIQIYD